MVTEIRYSERTRIWSPRLTGVVTGVMAAIGGLTRLIRAGGLSAAGWLSLMAGLAIVLLVLSTIRMVAEISRNDLTVRLLGIGLLDVQLDTIASIGTVHWRQPSGLARWALEDVMPLGGVRITTADGRQRFVASHQPDRLAELIRTYL